eukprot:1775635-Pyramimonas_sp.AAC.2
MVAGAVVARRGNLSGHSAMEDIDEQDVAVVAPDGYRAVVWHEVDLGIERNNLVEVRIQTRLFCFLVIRKFAIEFVIITEYIIRMMVPTSAKSQGVQLTARPTKQIVNPRFKV